MNKKTIIILCSLVFSLVLQPLHASTKKNYCYGVTVVINNELKDKIVVAGHNNGAAFELVKESPDGSSIYRNKNIAFPKVNEKSNEFNILDKFRITLPNNDIITLPVHFKSINKACEVSSPELVAELKDNISICTTTGTIKESQEKGLVFTIQDKACKK